MVTDHLLNHLQNPKFRDKRSPLIDTIKGNRLRPGYFVGRGDIRTYWAKDFTIINPMTVLTVTDSVVDEEMMLVHGNYQVLDRTTGVPQTKGRFAHIWVRDAAGKWLLDRDLWNQPADGDLMPPSP